MSEPWTPGPWGIDWNAPDFIIGDGSKNVAKVVTFEALTRMADARLISLAPEMAKVIAVWTSQVPFEGDVSDCMWCGEEIWEDDRSSIESRKHLPDCAWMTARDMLAVARGEA